jgi:hypothetical protein
VVFHFEKAGAIAVDVPVASPDQVTERSSAAVPSENGATE